MIRRRSQMCSLRVSQRFWERDDASKLPPDRVKRITMILDRLDASRSPADMNLPGLGFHQLSGRNKGRYASFCLC